MDDAANAARPTMRDAVKRELSERIDRKVREALLGPAKLPEGIVSMVFTDVEGSTGIVRDLGDAGARPILRRHDEVVREELATHAGTEVERDGDGFMLAFTLASGAVGFAIALHRAIAEAFGPGSERQLKVRIGIDTGEVVADEHGYFGVTVIRASRIAGLASGGQTLASESTRSIAEPVVAAMSEPVSFVPAGEHELKGLPGLHRLYDVRADPGR
jgi:class 3 adenylate cyclase